jgi:4-amino-4-deoxy-L-arabinose transferase-like glycosyltransferase
MRTHVVVVAIALLFAMLAMRGARTSDITYNDQARHAMNGVVIHDLVRDGAVFQAVAYYKRYFARFPALSMPYHPPMFPAVEAVFFALFGVSTFSARLAVACFVFATAVLTFRLVLETHRSVAVAFSATVIFFSLPLTQALSADVMLEMPALCFVTAAALYISGCENGWTTRRAVIAGLFCFAAIWTKQAVFVAMIPFLMALRARRWSAFWSKPFLLYAVLCVVAAGLMAMLWFEAGITSVPRQWAQMGVGEWMLQSSAYYARLLAKPQWWVPILAGTVMIVYGVRQRWWATVGDILHPLYVAWIICVGIVLLLLPATDPRYLWFAYLPALVLLLNILHMLLLRFRSDLVKRWALPILAVLTFFALLNSPLPYLTGPSHVAKAILKHAPRRVLVAGGNNGSIIFALRCQYAGSDLVALERLLHRLGVDVIVIEKVDTDEIWSYLIDAPIRNLKKQEVVTQNASDPSWRGKVFLFKHLNPSSAPDPAIDIPFLSTGRTLKFQL